MSKSYKFNIEDVNETQYFAKKLAKYLQPNQVITLEGDLGAGKTTFTQGLAKGLGIIQIVNSPTFTIIKEYQGRIPLYHMDVYRLEGGDEDLGFDDYFYGEGVTVIEWPSIISDYLPDNFLHIQISKVSEQSRILSLEPKGQEYIELCEEFISNENFSD